MTIENKIKETQPQVHIDIVLQKPHWDLFLPNLSLIVFSKFAIIFLQCFSQEWPSVPVPSWHLKDCPQSKDLFGMKVVIWVLFLCFYLSASDFQAPNRLPSVISLYQRHDLQSLCEL